MSENEKITGCKDGLITWNSHFDFHCTNINVWLIRTQTYFERTAWGCESYITDLFILFLFCLRVGVQFGLVWLSSVRSDLGFWDRILLGRWGWPLTHRDFSGSPSWVLGSLACATIPGCLVLFVWTGSIMKWTIGQNFLKS